MVPKIWCVPVGLTFPLGMAPRMLRPFQGAPLVHPVSCAAGVAQAFLIVSVVAATLRCDRLLAGKSLARW